MSSAHSQAASYWPRFLPYPQAIAVEPDRLVPNPMTMNWPHAQFQPAYLPANRNTPGNRYTNRPVAVSGGGGLPYGWGDPYGCACQGYGATSEEALIASVGAEADNATTKQQWALAFVAGVVVGSLLARRRA